LSQSDWSECTLEWLLAAASANGLDVAESETGTSETATYGPPYNHATGNSQSILFAPSTVIGVRQPIDAADTFVLAPPGQGGPTDPTLADALHRYTSAPPSTRQEWDAADLTAVTKVTFRNGTAVVPAAHDGPVPTMIATELTLARSGATDADLLANDAFYGTNFTNPLLFLEDGQYFVMWRRPSISPTPSGAS
jgi:hypothetical protein